MPLWRRAAVAVCRYDTIGLNAHGLGGHPGSDSGCVDARTGACPGRRGDPIVVSTEHPRLFLRPARLRLLRRERERTSLRWQQFHSLMAGNAAMPEPGFAHALYYEVAGDKDAGRKAIAGRSVPPPTCGKWRWSTTGVRI